MFSWKVEMVSLSWLRHAGDEMEEDTGAFNMAEKFNPETFAG